MPIQNINAPQPPPLKSNSFCKMNSNNQKHPELTPSEKNSIAQFMITNSTNGKVQRGKASEAASSFGVSLRCIQYVFNAAKKQIAQGKPVVFSSSKIGKKHYGGNTVVLDEEMMKAIPWERRSTIRRLAREMDTSKSTIHRWVKQGAIKAHSNAIKSILTDSNKVQRLKYCLNALRFDSEQNKIHFESMHNVVHIDEKWFYMTQKTERTYKLPSETDPYRSCKNKKYIEKIMFMCAVSRPQYTNEGELVFDGKFGIFPFTFDEAAKRKSKNRPKGTILTKPTASITKDVIRDCLIYQVIPAIKAKWPPHLNKTIFIQQDNARPHISNMDPEFRAAASTDGFNIQIVCQPPNSPDTNVNDLGWFRAIQSLQVETRSYKIVDLLNNVAISFENMEHKKLNFVFLSLQNCMIEIMKAKGCNSYKTPHMDKERHVREGTLPFTLEVDIQLVRDTLDYLVEIGGIETANYDLTSLMEALGYV